MSAHVLLPSLKTNCKDRSSGTGVSSMRVTSTAIMQKKAFHTHKMKVYGTAHSILRDVCFPPGKGGLNDQGVAYVAFLCSSSHCLRHIPE